MTLLDRINIKEEIEKDDEIFREIHEIKEVIQEKVNYLNSNLGISREEKNKIISEIIGEKLDDSVEISLPFQTDFGRHIKFGKDIFINKDVMFVDLGGITIEDNVLIGPRTTLISVGHIMNPKKRRGLTTSPVRIKKNAWLGANVTICPGVVVGENAVVAAGSVVTKDVAANTVVGGVPAKIIKNI